MATAVLALAALVLGPALLGGANETGREAPEVAARPVPATAQTQSPDISYLSAARRTPIVDAVRRVIPSVAGVNVIRRQRAGPRSFFEDFFVPFGYEREVASLGSGFAIAPGGYVLTNAHVVQGAVEIVVTLVDGEEYDAELIGTDELSDLALLRVDLDLAVPNFGDADGLVTGEPAVALGNPFGYLLSNAEPTVTAGVISGVGRHILPTAFAGSGDAEQTIYADMIQTDASINPGNSGGPLINAEGEVVGVNSAIFTRSGGSQGLGFAIPINRAIRIAEQLRSDGEVRRPWVGIDVGTSEAGRTGQRRGAVIVRVAPGSPADRQNLEAGMELIEIGGRPVKSTLDWEAELFNVAPGERLVLTVRDQSGREREVTLRVEDLPSVRAARVEVLEGLELTTLTPAIRVERGLRQSQGALIVQISDEVTRATGLREGDLIVAINRRRVSGADDVAEMLDYLAGRGAIRIHYERDSALWSTVFRIVNER